MEQRLKASFYILDEHLNPADIKLLDDLAQRPASRWFEFIVLHAPADTPKTSRVIYASGLSETDKLIMESGGEWQVLVTLSELQSHYDYFTNNFMRVRHGHAIAILPSQPTLLERLGVRNLSATSFVAFRKYFITASPYLKSLLVDPASRLKMVKLADRTTTLFLVRNSALLAESGVSPLPRYSKFLRPYLRISLRLSKQALRQFYIFLAKLPRRIKAYYRQLTARKIHYSNDIPVFINCRDRVSTLKILVDWLEKEKLTNIIFIDNNSTYPPLLDYFAKTKYNVVRLRENAGHTAPWLSGSIQVYAAGKPYIVSDPDILPAEAAHGAVKHFVHLLNKYPKYQKVGFGLKIDDIPDSYELKQTVINWESQFWEKEKEKDVYIADLDTTFALYRPDVYYLISPALRTGGDFVAQHEPWYLDSQNINPEVTYYRAHADKQIGSWGVGGGDYSEVYAANEDNIAHSSA